MNIITRIENELKAINQASFQTLINHLLHMQGNKFVGAPGAVVAKDKTSKGSPDSFFMNEGSYLFVECTTKEKLGESKSFFEKLSNDIDHCFTEGKTGIVKEKIEKVILACTEKLNTAEHESLLIKVQSYHLPTQLEVLNIQNLPLLLYDFPKLAEEYLNVPIVKGDIFTLPEFLLKTNKGLQPSLTNEFTGRRDELKKCMEALSHTDRLLLTGGQGVGKSRLAVQVLQELSCQNYIPVVIQSCAVPLYVDFQHYFQTGKNYIVLFDDANKSIQNLNYLLTAIDKSTTFSIKVIITSRDYVKKQVVASLTEYSFTEIEIPVFKDEEVEDMIIKALPDLQHFPEIKRKIIPLARGNARVALMATYSVTPDAETNFLRTPLLLYEKYFQKIANEIGIFHNPIILKSLAIVSFFGVLDKNNEELQKRLAENLGINWNELWSAIMELHTNEILDVYSNEVVKVSDQVLGAYAFYKCFIDQNSAVIDYADWISTFTNKYSHRIRASLIDANNTFLYLHIKELVVPHLNKVIKIADSEEQLYSFYELFWFYKDRECLLYLKKWISALPEEAVPSQLNFIYGNNDYSKASPYFDILKNFWSHCNELTRPAIELGLDLILKQPSRLPEVLKYLNDGFKYTMDDPENGYLRQNIFLDVLLDEKLSGVKKTFGNGVFMHIAEGLLGWQYREAGGMKGKQFTIYTFSLYKSAALLKLRERILLRFYQLFEPSHEQSQKILRKIIHPDGKFDQTIYADELPLYQQLVDGKLNPAQLSHCEFVKTIAQYLTKLNMPYPDSWNSFIQSEIMQLSQFLTPSWEYRENQSIEESEKEKKKEINEFINLKDWKAIEQFLLHTDALYREQTDSSAWFIEEAVANIYIAIAGKGRIEFQKALDIFFSGQLKVPLRVTVMNFALQHNVLSGKELLAIINEFEFKTKPYWLSVLLTMLPDEQADEHFLELLINIFESAEDNIYLTHLPAYLKYSTAFEAYKNEHPLLANHNIITYLTTLLLSCNRQQSYPFGFHFCTECAPFFSNHQPLFQATYLAQKKLNRNYDHDGQELKAVLASDPHFIYTCLKNELIALKFGSQNRLEDFPVTVLWDIDKGEALIEEVLLTIIEKAEYISFAEEDIYSLFIFHKNDDSRTKRVQDFILHLTRKYIGNDKITTVLLLIATHVFRNWFVDYFREFLLLNKNIDLVRAISFSRSESWSGSRVPVIERKIEFYQAILAMIDTLPDILDYTSHIEYFEQKIAWNKKDIQEELKRDFQEEHY